MSRAIALAFVFAGTSIAFGTLWALAAAVLIGAGVAGYVWGRVDGVAERSDLRARLATYKAHIGALRPGEYRMTVERLDTVPTGHAIARRRSGMTFTFGEHLISIGALT
jgi:hypothetical protein